jgi:tetratricopeptide (TPR) repeat protein
MAATWFKQTEQVLALLRSRARRWGQKSSAPSCTLAWALGHLERGREALTVLEEAIAARPTDGQLLLYAADVYASSSTEHLPRTRALLKQAQGNAPRPQWLRMAAKLHQADGETGAALRIWREVLETQPLAIDAHRAVARLLAETEGTAAALAYLAQAAEGFPHLYPLQQLWIEWLRNEPEPAREAVLRKVAAAFPDDAWIHRELGFWLGNQRRLSEAWDEAKIANRLEPTSPAIFHLREHLLKQEGRLEERGARMRQSRSLSITTLRSRR